MRSARKRAGALAATAAVLAQVAAGCGSSSSTPPSSSGPPVKGGTATVAVTSGTQPNYIWPFVPATHYSVYNSEMFQWLMYRPLYMFGGNGQSVAPNYGLSPADKPAYSDGGKTVTITMKGWKWSDGESVDAKDVAFWINMEKAEKANYAGFSPGTFPDNLASYSITSPNTIVLHLTKAYSSSWFTYNQLAEITPMPMAWDVTSMGAKKGSGGCATSPANCKAVYKFLSAQAQHESSYPTSAIWGVVDGPWKLSGFSATGQDSFVPNRSYSGTPKPRISSLKFQPYTSPTAEFTALKSGSVDVSQPLVGLPQADLPPKPTGAAVPMASLIPGYTLMPQYTFAINYYQPNFKNPMVGPMCRQLYFRQALEHLVDQRENGGNGPFAFSVVTATSLMTSHGWKMVNGEMTCENPAKCGAGIPKGRKAAFSLAYSTNSSTLPEQAQAFSSDASKAGINVKVIGQTFNTIISQDVQSNFKNWSMSGYGGWAYNGPGFLPTGEPLYETSAGANYGSYSNPVMDKLIKTAQTPRGGLVAFDRFATYAAQQLPLIYTPEPYLVQAVQAKLHGVGFSPLGTLLPEYWHFTK